MGSGQFRVYSIFKYAFQNIIFLLFENIEPLLKFPYCFKLSNSPK